MISKKELMMQVFRLNKEKASVLLLFWSSKKRFAIKDLVKKTGKDRTTIQKMIVVLLNKNLITKSQKNLARGFRYYYEIGNRNRLLDRINVERNKIHDEMLKTWCNLHDEVMRDGK